MRVFIANRASGEQARVNVRCLVNSAEIRREKRNGRDVIIVPSATMPDDVVMNGILYPAAEIAKSFKSLERTPAPLGHPEINGRFVSASDPEGLNQSWIGAWNENVRQEKGRVRLDKVIDVEIANRSEGGKAVLSAIHKGSPVHTSTGLLCILDAANGDVEHNFTARDIVFDHDAILLDEDGAATPEQGVGMMVNASGQEIEVINCSLAEDADRDLDWALDSAFRALEKRARVPLLERFKTAVIEAFSGSERSPSTNKQENDMAVSDEQFKALSDEVKTLSDGMKGLGDTIATAVGNAVTAAVKPLVDAQAEIANAQKAKDEDELKGLREKIVKANLMEEAEAGELTLNAARALAKKAEPGHAAAVNGAFKPSGAARDAYKLPEAKEA